MLENSRKKVHMAGMLIFLAAALMVPSKTVKADEANVHFGSRSYEATEGDAFTVGVYVTTEEGVGPYAVTVNYDPDVLEYVGGADAVDTANGVLGFSGNYGGPEVKYLVNFNVIGNGDTSVSFSSATVYPLAGGDVLPTTMASRAPITVEPAPEEEEEEEDEPVRVVQTPVTSKVTEVPDTQTEAATEDVTEEKASFFENKYFLIFGIMLAVLVGVEIVLIAIKMVFIRQRKNRLKKRAADHKFENDDDFMNLEEDAYEDDEYEDEHDEEYDDEDYEEDYEDEEVVEEPEDDVVISVDHVTMKFKVATQNISSLKDFFIQLVTRKLSYRELLALDDITFDVHKGEVMGIIGTNGSGKSTLLKIVSGALRPTSGKVNLDRRKVQLLTLGTGFDMELTARENVYLNGALIGYSRDFLDEHYDEIVEFAELEGFMEEKVKNFSSGMVSRLGFAIATAGDAADILILDEVLSVGDEFFRKKSLKRVKEMIHCGSTVLLVSHGMGTILDNCTRVVWIEKGRMKMIGDPKIVCSVYRNMGASA